MNAILSRALLAVALLLSTGPLGLACPMCKESVFKNQDLPPPPDLAFNVSVLFMLACMGAVGYGLFRMCAAAIARADARNAARFAELQAAESAQAS